ncbi:MAG: enoyl-CoA hydratase [Halomonadaceae bacterium]|nr:MAG: enoyl-CoA hydratase [Halomonadaceae bacterium]
MSAPIQIETQGFTRIVRIHRPQQKNALTHAMYTIMADTLEAAEQDASVRSILFTGDADCFTAGNDLGEFADGMPDSFEKTPVGRFLVALATANKPVVAAVNGPAVGIGTTLLLHCDLALAGDNTRFQMPFVNLGLCPEGGSSLLLPRWLGRVRAMELLLLGRPFDAHEALRLNLINRVCPPADTENEALALCEQINAQPPAAIRTSKALFNRGQNEALLDTLLVEGRHFAERLDSAEAREAFGAFREKRKADFSQFD